MLRDHMKANHSSDIKCKDCRSTFGDQSKFEEHLVNEHGKEKTFDCEFCDDSFYTDWRLRKHIRSHEEPNIKFCHYYKITKLHCTQLQNYIVRKKTEKFTVS